MSNDLTKKYADIGSRLKRMRLKKEWSQEKLAEMLKVTRTSITNYESGLSVPSFDIIKKIVNIFDIDYNFLLAGTVGGAINTADQLKEIYDNDDLVKEIKELKIIIRTYQDAFDRLGLVKKEGDVGESQKGA